MQGSWSEQSTPLPVLSGTRRYQSMDHIPPAQSTNGFDVDTFQRGIFSDNLLQPEAFDGRSLSSYYSDENPQFNLQPSTATKVHKETSGRQTSSIKLADERLQASAQEKYGEEDGKYENGTETESLRYDPQPTPSIHPLEILTKKLRCQETELSGAHEQVAQKLKEVERLKQVVEKQKQQIDRLEVSNKALQTYPSVRPTKTTAKKEKAVSKAPSIRQREEVLKKQIQETQNERKKYIATAKRVEAALKEFQKRSEEEGSEDSDSEAGQKSYIRVLEEVLHMKADELNVSDHEELLLVLTELRQTVHRHSITISVQKEELERTSDALSRQEEEYNQLKAMQIKVEEGREKLKSRLNIIGSEKQALETSFENVSAKLSELQNEVEETRKESNDLKSKREKDKQKRREGRKAYEDLRKYSDDQTRRLEKLERESSKLHNTINELRGVQEELLLTIDKHVNDVTTAEHEKQEIQQQLQNIQQICKQDKDGHATVCQAKDVEMLELKKKITEAEQRAKDYEMWYYNAQSTIEQSTKDHDDKVSVLTQSLDAVESESQDIQIQLHQVKEKYNTIREGLVELEAAALASVNILHPLQDIPPSACLVPKHTQLPRANCGSHVTALYQFSTEVVSRLTKMSKVLSADRSEGHENPVVILLQQTILKLLEMEDKVAMCIQEKEEYESINVDLESTCSYLLDQMTRAQQDAEQACGEAFSLEMQLYKAQNMLDHLDEEVSDLKESYASVKSERILMEEQKEKLRKQKKQLKTVLKQNAEFMHLETDLASKLESKKEELEKWTTEAEEKDGIIKSLNADIRALEEEIAWWKDQLETKTREIADWRERLLKATEQIEVYNNWSEEMIDEADKSRNENHKRKQVEEQVRHYLDVFLQSVQFRLQRAMHDISTPQNGSPEEDGASKYKEEVARKELERVSKVHQSGDILEMAKLLPLVILSSLEKNDCAHESTGHVEKES